jgi:pimeloyl-ACP methyl ester carboxylesterase
MIITAEPNSAQVGVQSTIRPLRDVHYRRVGPRGGVPLVLLNRVRGTVDWWDPELLDHLAADRNVIVFDNIGVGYTTGEPRDSVEGSADGAIEFIADDISRQVQSGLAAGVPALYPQLLP